MRIFEMLVVVVAVVVVAVVPFPFPILGREETGLQAGTFV